MTRDEGSIYPSLCSLVTLDTKWLYVNMDHIREKLDAFLESTMEKGLVADGVVAQGSSQAASFWQLREVS